jgi:MoaA/NifB/PqqE/SkfB family radical SAM enzyme
MQIQSLSVVVPAKRCINRCKFCVSCMREEKYPNQLEDNVPFYDLYDSDYSKRLEFARDNGCNTVMLTGNTEPQQNREFLRRFGTMNSALQKPFRWIEMQTTGVMLDDAFLRHLRNHVGVTTISLSISSFDSEENSVIVGMLNKLAVNIPWLCGEIKRYDFNLRLSINMTNKFEQNPEEIFRMSKSLGADQVTFRKLYTSGDNDQSRWIESNRLSDTSYNALKSYIMENGRKLEVLPYGAIKYSIHGMGTVMDDDCMAQEVKDSYKYLILRPNAKLYTKWDDPASLLF